MEQWKNEHKLLIAFLEEHTGKKMDYDRLKETVRLSYRLTELTLEIEELIARSRPPCPANAWPPRCWRCACLPGPSTAWTTWKR